MSVRKGEYLDCNKLNPQDINSVLISDDICISLYEKKYKWLSDSG